MRKPILGRPKKRWGDQKGQKAQKKSVKKRKKKTNGRRRDRPMVKLVGLCRKKRRWPSKGERLGWKLTRDKIKKKKVTTPKR